MRRLASQDRRKRAKAGLAVALACAALAGMAWDQHASYRAPDGIEAYHARVRAAVAAIPTRAGTLFARDLPEMPKPAQKLLKPNAARSLLYTDLTPGRPGANGRATALTFVHCRRPADMYGHYPPNCYPAQGYAEAAPPTVRSWRVGNEPLRGTVYTYERPADGGSADGPRVRNVIYDLLLVPGRGAEPDMTALLANADDYRMRYYGAAQVWVVFASLPGSELTEVERDDAFRALIGSALPAVKAVTRLDAPAPAADGLAALPPADEPAGLFGR